jgi:protocatechuate 3,4-dioxygenase beta subunit
MRFSFVLLSCFLLLLSATAAQTAVSKPASNCTVQGQIIQQPGGQPIRKANVRLSGAAEEEGDEGDLVAVTDANGHFKIEDVKPGAYRVAYDHPGFVDAEKRHHGNGMLLSLAAGQEIKDLIFHMLPAAVITGKVTDIDGDPVPRVSVAALPPHFWQDREPIASGWGATNDLGEYRISDLAPNRYTIVAEPPSGLAPPAQPAKATEKNGLVYVATYYPGTSERSRALSLDLHAGDEVPVNITLGMAQPFHVRGQINLTVETREDANIVLRPLDEDFTRKVSPWPVDKEGKFDISGVFPGSYSVLLISGSHQHPSVMRGNQTVQVTSSDVEGLRISPVPNGQVRGRFRMDNGGKMDWSQTEVELHSPLPGRSWRGSAVDISIEALWWDDRPAHAELRKDGSFEIKDVPPDTYLLSMRARGKVLDSCFVKAVKLGGEDVGDAGFSIAGGSYSLDVVVGANGATVDGFVTDDEDKSASDVYVLIAPSGEAISRRDFYQVTKTDNRGRFGLTGLNPGEFVLFAADEDPVQTDLMGPKFLHTHESLGKSLQLKEGEHQSVELKLAPAVN